MLLTKYSQLKHGMKVKCEYTGKTETGVILERKVGDSEFWIEKYLKLDFDKLGQLRLIIGKGKENTYYFGSDTVSYVPFNLRTADKTSLREVEVGDVIVDSDGEECKVLAVGPEHLGLSYVNHLDKPGLTWSFTELEKFTFKDQSPDLTTLTLQQVADKFNIPVDQLRIKE